MAKRKRRKKNAESLNVHEVPMKSGFTISIKPLPPYYKDLVDETIPLPEYPIRIITLASGDEVDWPYKPEDEHSDPEHEDYDLYVQWKSVDAKVAKLTKIRNKSRMDFLLSSCVDVVDGPYGVNDDEWAWKVEAAFEGWTMPTHQGRRYLVFLKTQVITDAEDMELVIGLSTSPEVTMQGILSALRGFPVDVEQGESGEDSGHAAEEQSVSQSQIHRV
jgi:hypothetical protein